MHESDDSSDIVSTLLGAEKSRREVVGDTAKLGGSALALSALGTSGVGASGADDSGTEDASVTLENQATDGTSVTVQSATLPEGGFVAIHDTTLLEGAVLESVIGVSEPLDAGTHKDVVVPLFEGVPGGEFEQSALQETQPLIPMPHLDTNDNGTYDFITSGGQEDGPYTKDGAPVVGLGYAAIEG